MGGDSAKDEYSAFKARYYAVWAPLKEFENFYFTFRGLEHHKSDPHQQAMRDIFVPFLRSGTVAKSFKTEESRIIENYLRLNGHMPQGGSKH